MRILSRHCKLPAIDSTVSVLQRCPYREVQLHLNKDYSLYRCVRYLFSLATILNFIVIIHQYLWQFIPGLSTRLFFLFLSKPGPNDINVLIPLLIILLLFLLIVVAVIVICCKRYVRLSVIPFCAVIILLLVMVAVSVAVLGSNFIVIRRLEKLFHVCIVEIQNRFSIVLQVI